MTLAEVREAVTWCVHDARYLARWARIYRKRGLPADSWLAGLAMENARASMKLARRYKAQAAV